MKSSDVLLTVATKYLNTPYIFGGKTFNGIDCSGLTQELLAAIGAKDFSGDLTAQGIYNHYYGNSEAVKAPGSLCFYGQSVTHIDHVTLMLDDFYVVSASGGTSDTNTLQEAIDKRACVKIRPFNYRKDLVAVLRPFIVRDLGR